MEEENIPATPDDGKAMNKADSHISCPQSISVTNEHATLVPSTLAAWPSHHCLRQ